MRPVYATHCTFSKETFPDQSLNLWAPILPVLLLVLFFSIALMLVCHTYLFLYVFICLSPLECKLYESRHFFLEAGIKVDTQQLFVAWMWIHNMNELTFSYIALFLLRQDYCQLSYRFGNDQFPCGFRRQWVIESLNKCGAFGVLENDLVFIGVYVRGLPVKKWPSYCMGGGVLPVRRKTMNQHEKEHSLLALRLKSSAVARLKPSLPVWRDLRSWYIGKVWKRNCS